MAPETVRLHIFRYDAFRGESHSYDSYDLPYQHNDQLLDLLERIKTEHDHTLSYRRSCRHGICGSCSMKVNGKPVLACSTPVRDLVMEFGRKLTVEPLDRSRVIRDLICDMDDFWEKISRSAPYLEPVKAAAAASAGAPPVGNAAHASRLLFIGSINAIDDADHCIMCGACYSACPVIPLQPDFLGPAAIVRSYRFAKDVRDARPGRLITVGHAGTGVWECIKCLKCTEVCPKQIDPFAKVSRLHQEVLRSGSSPGGVRARHTRGFQLNLLLNGLLNEFPLAVYAMRFRMITMLRRGIRMFLHGKLVINPLRPRSRGYRQIRRLMRRSQ
ncbi:MAG: succinate dehydrogenase/fumarate reductase iron-sulfur subunit [Sediminispirochaetaceae bacterium]